MKSLTGWGPMNWRAPLALITAAPLLAACQTTTGFVPGGPVTAWVKSGTTRAQRHLEYEECLLEAGQKIQPAMIVDQVPYTGVPDTIQQVPDFSPTPAIHVDAPPAAFGTNVGESLGHLGQVEENAGNELFNNSISHDAYRSTQQLYVKVCLEKKGYNLAQTKYCLDPHDETTEDCVIPH
jgi:hypothetical protein